MSGTAVLWFGLLGGTTAWAAHLLVSYAIVALGCGPLGETAVRVLLVVVTVLTGAVAVVSLVAARQITPARTTWRLSFARAGVLLDGLAIFGIIVAGTLPFALRAC